MAQHTVTDSLIQANYYTILPLAQGLIVPETAEGGTVTALLTTSQTSFSNAAGYALTTYEREEGDTDGPFAVAVSVADDGGGQIMWFTSSLFLEDMYNAYSSGANGDLGMNALSAMIGESEAVAIRSKSLNYNYPHHQRIHGVPAQDPDDRRVPAAVPGPGDRSGDEKTEAAE